MVYWDFADTLTIGVLILDAWSIVLAYGLTRVTGGAPKAWYLIIAAFGVRLIRMSVWLYLDVQSPETMIGEVQEGISLVVAALFAIGLFLLLRTFRRTVEAAGPNQSRF